MISHGVPGLYGVLVLAKNPTKRPLVSDKLNLLLKCTCILQWHALCILLILTTIVITSCCLLGNVCARPMITEMLPDGELTDTDANYFDVEPRVFTKNIYHW